MRGGTPCRASPGPSRWGSAPTRAAARPVGRPPSPRATGFTDAVAIALGSNPGGSALSGTTPVAAVSGVATFFVSLNKAGTGYTLTASASGLAPATSTAFDIIPGTATQLAFTVQPSTTVAGVAISPAVQVTALDAAGQPVPGFTGRVTVGN